MNESKFNQFIKDQSPSFKVSEALPSAELEKKFERRLQKERKLTALGGAALGLIFLLIGARVFFDAPSSVHLKQADYDFLEEVYSYQENPESDYDYYSMLPTD